MSWKLRRAGWKPVDPGTAKIFNAFTGASIICTFLGFVAYQLPVIGGLIAILWLLSLVTTPWLVCMTLAGGTWGYGLPNINSSKLNRYSNKNDQGESTWQSWIEEDRKKREVSKEQKLLLKKKTQKDKKEREKKEIKEKLARYKLEAKALKKIRSKGQKKES